MESDELSAGQDPDVSELRHHNRQPGCESNQVTRLFHLANNHPKRFGVYDP
jgi:hypothetical protein